MKNLIFIAITFLFALGSANAQLESVALIKPFEGDCSELSFEEGFQVGCSLANLSNGVTSSSNFADYWPAQATFLTYRHCSEYIMGFQNGWAECRNPETFDDNLAVGNTGTNTKECDHTGGCGTGFKCVGGDCVPI